MFFFIFIFDVCGLFANFTNGFLKIDHRLSELIGFFYQCFFQLE